MDVESLGHIPAGSGLHGPSLLKIVDFLPYFIFISLPFSLLWVSFVIGKCGISEYRGERPLLRKEVCEKCFQQPLPQGVSAGWDVEEQNWLELMPCSPLVHPTLPTPCHSDQAHTSFVMAISIQ